MTSTSRSRDSLQYDVVVAGASLAGCASARLLGQLGLRVLMVDPKPDPDAYKRTCTHIIQSSAASTIERLGLLTCIEQAGAARTRLDVWTPWGWITPPESGSRAQGRCFAIRRERLDPLLRGLATGTSGVEYLPGYSATRLHSDQGTVAGVTIADRNGNERRVRARLTVAADGRNSTVATLADVKTRWIENCRFGHWAYFRDVPRTEDGRGRMWLLDPDLGFVIPNDSGLTLVACLMTRDRLDEFSADRDRSFFKAINALPDGPTLRPEQMASPLFGMVETKDASRRAALPGLALVGDAAVAADPISGVGCGWALESAALLTDCVGQALVENGSLDSSLVRYRREHRRSYALHHRMIATYSNGRPFNFLEKIMFAAAARDDRTAEHLSRYVERELSVREYLRPSAILRATLISTRGRWRSQAPAVAKQPI